MPKRENKEKILAALLYCNTRKEAAAYSGVSERTLYSYLQDPEFVKEYEGAKKELIRSASEQIQRSLEPSITALRAIAEDKAAGKTARVQAARSLLEYGIKLAEFTDLEDRIAALERAAGGAVDEKPI